MTWRELFRRAWLVLRLRPNAVPAALPLLCEFTAGQKIWWFNKAGDAGRAVILDVHEDGLIVELVPPLRENWKAGPRRVSTTEFIRLRTETAIETAIERPHLTTLAS